MLYEKTTSRSVAAIGLNMKVIVPVEEAWSVC